MPFDPVAFIAAQEWRFATTMPQWPHEYIVREKVADDASFDALVRHIRQHGEPRALKRKLYLYWQHDGHVYWTMGWPVDETIIINRARLEDWSAVPVHGDLIKDGRWSSKDGRRPPL